MKVDVGVPGSPSLISLMVSVDVKQHLKKKKKKKATVTIPARHIFFYDVLRPQKPGLLETGKRVEGVSPDI